ncbi:Nuclear control of ATPase protein 2 [Leucoagaricus sp. SymC.cos]|nr:Nuclear control of ATPase protein 2 [Leucoagaricus sp. SymC.cos]
MPSQFIDNFTHPLVTTSPSLPFVSLNGATEEQNSRGKVEISATKHALHALLVSFPHSQPLNAQQIRDAVSILSSFESQSISVASDPEEGALRNAVIAKVAVGLYAEALKIYLSQATEVEAEAEWWRDIERSRVNVAWYLLQTTPSRLFSVVETVVAAVRSQNIPLSISTFTPSSLSRLFPTSPTSPFRPSILTTACFPRLAQTSLAVTASLHLPTVGFSSSTGLTQQFVHTTSYYFAVIASYISYPLSLTRQECYANRRDLENIRNERAEILGQLSQMRNNLSSILTNPGYEYSGTIQFLPKVQRFVEILDQKAAVDTDIIYPSVVEALAHLSDETLPELSRSHQQMLKSNRLLRPRKWILIWPKVLLLPPLALYVCKSLYASRASLEEVAKDTVETVKAFVQNWLLEPLRDVLRTVRSGSDDEAGVLVRKEGVLADLDSLERMTLSLAKDELHYNEEQLAALSRQIRSGDMTPVMRVYEDDIRTPLKSAIAGTLLRNVFIQVQKAKVDIDQALTGIDRLLKSQELTFAFVGVAPALAIVYLAGGAINGTWTGRRGRSRYGRLQERKGVWEGMRRIERLLITQPTDTQQVATLPSGLMLLTLARLRLYAIDNLPANSRLREGFLEDLNDLENPDLGRDAKLEVVHRMWRCWGVELGWERCGKY